MDMCMMKVGKRELNEVYLGYLLFPRSKASPKFLAAHVTSVSNSRFSQCFMSTNKIPYASLYYSTSDRQKHIFCQW